MAKNAAYTGTSAKDRAINIMDKFISRNNKRAQSQPPKPAIRKDVNIPLELWPLKDQIEYWETRTSKDRFNEVYPIYSYWIVEVQKQTKVHPTFFTDATIKMKPDLLEFYATCTDPKEVARELRKRGIY
jgi:hypothetical protein